MIALGLVHYPVLGKQKEIIRTSVTNLDIHDISRTCRTFGIDRFEIITPIERQHALIGRLLSHWRKARSFDFNPHRHEALELVHLSESLEQSCKQLEADCGEVPYIVVTGAQIEGEKNLSAIIADWKKIAEKRALFILFGTGHGLAPEVIDQADASFPRIKGLSLANSGKSEYNHLSVRSAAAIYCYQLSAALSPV